MVRHQSIRRISDLIIYSSPGDVMQTKSIRQAGKFIDCALESIAK